MMPFRLSLFSCILVGFFLVDSVPAFAASVRTPARDGQSTDSKRNRGSASSQTRPSTVVVIDAGHGGFDHGGIPGQKVPEKVMTLDVALRLRDLLKQSGYTVVMTRDRDVFVPLPTRVAIANAYRNAIFVCIHFNSASRSGANGIETYFYSPQSLPLASAIHYHVVRGAPSPNRGVRRRGYYVLRKTRVPAVLVECGFLTNPNEARYAQTVAYREKLADEIATGISGRSSVVSASGPAVAVAVADGGVPLQPFIDQTRVSQHHGHHRSSRSKHSPRKKSKSKIESDDSPLASSSAASAKSKREKTSDNTESKRKSRSAPTED